ncbi:MAG: MBL fold metallo-hydrolase [Gammaproteobacteria bacterium]|nr:MBL fold metallo-hydrolase [Gammaproteobacteria bacterium]
MDISFHGANRGVTGSCHLVRCGDTKILIDCGLYQGGRELKEENFEPFGFEPSEIDYLLLTHGHLDHCGRIPLLVKYGFRGEIITTSATRELARLVMLDSAHLHEEDARWQTRKLERREHEGEVVEPLYTSLDALNSLDFFNRTVAYDEPLKLGEGIRARFMDAGHILGSACILLELKEAGKWKKILFSGDLGYSGRVILGDPAPPPEVDVVVMETTYGDRCHKRLEPSISELYEAITDTFKRGGNVVIPSFALERTQEILYYLREGVEEGLLPSSMQVFLDSPMAISATEIFRRHPECYDDEACKLFSHNRDPFNFHGLHFTQDTSDSIALNRFKSGVVIIAGSGMCTGGRIRHHLKHNLWRDNCSVVFVGFASRGTLARRLVDGAKVVRIFGDEISVRARIYTIGGFSAHADRDELLAWHAQLGNPKRTFLVHGEEKVMEAFSERLEDTEVIMPKVNQQFKL